VFVHFEAFIAISALLAMTPGAAYLAFLGGQALWAALRGTGPRVEVGLPGATRLRPRLAFRQGLVCNLGNPKIAIFFTTFLPQFARGDHPPFAALLLLALAFCAIGLSWLSLYNVAISKIGDFLRRPRMRRVIEGITGAVLVAFGVRLALERR
jgi:threonine/homoserine/homoserine lactone efflux protein